MPQPTWTTVEGPILAAIAELPARAGLGPSSDDIAQVTGLSLNVVVLALQRLFGAQYITGFRFYGSTYFTNLQLLERGLRDSGVWPSDDPFEELVRVLNEQINREPDQERAGRLRRLLSAVVEAGRDIGVGVLTELATRGTLGR
jgi:hypothetical protein